MNYNISLVIVTYKRADILKRCIQSVISQKIQPIEIIIVDSDELRSAKSIYEKYKNKIRMKYVFNNTNSLTSGRNLGVYHSKGDIIYFLDDDTEIVGNDFFKNIIKEYKLHPNATGIQGEIIRNKHKFAIITNFLNKLFFLAYRKKNQSLVLPSFRLVTPFPLTKTIKCQWFTGGNCSYKREIFNKYRFDENLIKYSFGEDIDFSYNLYKNGKLLYMTPNAKLIHNKIKEKRTENPELIIMTEIYRYYIFYKYNKNKLNHIIYWYSTIANSIKNIFKKMIYPRKSIKYILNIIRAHVLIIKNINNIKSQDLTFYNKLNK